MSYFSEDWFIKLNEYGRKRKACYFIIDFYGKSGKVFTNQVNDDFIFDFSGQRKKLIKPLKIECNHIDYSEFKSSFNVIKNALHRGDSYLINLTFSTPIRTNYTLDEIFKFSKAKYKVLHKNHWVCFSPEPFIKTNNNHIFTYPMKGTIDAEITNAKEVLLKNQKELAEHYTIVDLLRNDLSTVAKNVRVKRFRYIEKIQKHKGSILQTSTEIKGELINNWQNNLGNMLKRLLPAGSISGAPKQKTIQIIEEAEQYERGFYTGIAGHFDGENLNTAVMIRFIENKNGQLYFKSGGGITAKSDAKDEYKEIQDKIYIPL